MSFICITNKGHIDPMAFKLIGASSKRSETNKIGYFGSGLKYGMAVLLRLGIKFQIFSGNDEIKVETKDVDFRGEIHKMILINGAETGFTTGMGPDWKLWFAIREIYCNAMDEELGAISIQEDIVLVDDETQFIIELNAELGDIMEKFNNYFSAKRTDLVWSKNNDFIYNRSSENSLIYRKGIRVSEDKKTSLFDYDLEKIKINESRVIASDWDFKYLLASIITSVDDEDVIKKYLFELWKNEKNLEYSMYFGGANGFCSKWRQVIGNTPIIPHESSGFYAEDYDINKCIVLPKAWIVKLVESFKDLPLAGNCGTHNNISYKIVPPSAWEETIFKQVRQWYVDTKLNLVLNPEEFDIQIAKFDNPAIYGMALVEENPNEDDEENVKNRVTEKKKILVSLNAFKKGKQEVAATLWEEMVHANFYEKDKTKAMQTRLIDLMLVYAQHINCLPL